MWGIHGGCVRGEEAISSRHGRISVSCWKSGRRCRCASASTSPSASATSPTTASTAAAASSGGSHVKTRQIILRRHLRCHRPPSCSTFQFKFKSINQTDSIGMTINSQSFISIDRINQYLELIGAVIIVIVSSTTTIKMRMSIWFIRISMSIINN